MTAYPRPSSNISPQKGKESLLQAVERKLESGKLSAFTFQVDDRPADFIVEWFCKWLQSYIAGGADISDGQTLQVGYTLIRCSIDSQILRLESPEFISMPIQWHANLGPALQLLGWHKYVPESCSLESDIPRFGQTAIVGQNYDSLPMFGNRLEATGVNDSGWFFGSMLDDVDNNDPDQLSEISLYEAMISIPNMAPYLSLPTDCQVLFKSPTPELLKGYERLVIEPGSMIDLLHRGQ